VEDRTQERGAMNGKIAVGVLSGALLLSGLLVGISYGEPATITEFAVLELYWRTGHEDSAIESFLFDPNGGFCNDSDPVCGQVTLKDMMPLFDIGGMAQPLVEAVQSD